MSALTKTRRFAPKPCAMLVALADDAAQLCTDLLKPLTAAKPMQVMRVGHVRAACERMLVTRPMVVVYPDALGAEEKATLGERAVDIRAEVVILPRALDAEDVRQRLVVAVRDASERADG